MFTHNVLSVQTNHCSGMGDDQGRRPKHTGDKNEDYILEDIVGGNGWWQWRTTIALFPLIWAGGIPLFLSVFAAYTPPHRCLVEQCDGPEAENVFNASYLRWAVPRGTSIKQTNNLWPLTSVQFVSPEE